MLCKNNPVLKAIPLFRIHSLRNRILIWAGRPNLHRRQLSPSLWLWRTWCVRSERTQRCSCHCTTRWSPSLSGKRRFMPTFVYLHTHSCIVYYLEFLLMNSKCCCVGVEVRSVMNEKPVKSQWRTHWCHVGTWPEQVQPAFLGIAAVTPEWSCAVFLLHQSSIVSQWISIWINIEAMITHLLAFIWSVIDAVRCEVCEILFFFFFAVIPPSQWKLPGEMVKFRSGEGHRPAT